jgi:hypothetical protein
MEMSVQTPHGPGTGCALLMSCVVLLAPISESAATTPIYKCLDKNYGLTYTDEPCKDGELMNIRAGDADPAAVARLDRARDAVDQSAAQRIADQRRAAEQRDLAAWYAREDERYVYDYTAAYTPYDYGAIGWFPGFGRHHPLRTRPMKLLEPRHFAPKPPHMVPQR